MKRNGIAALLLAMVFGVTACGEVEQGNQEEHSDGILSWEEKQQNTVQEPDKPKQAESEEEAGGVSGSGYPIIVETENAPFIEYVMESEGVYCVYGHKRQQDCYFGFLTETGEEIAPFIYEEATPFSEGLACVYLDGKYGYIDKNGGTVLPFVYDYAAPFSEGLAYFATGETYGFMDKNGETVFTLNCDSVSSFREGLAYFSIDGKYGYIDRKGATVIQPVYDDADFFRDGRARVRTGGYYGVIDVHGWEVLPAVYDSISFEEEYILAQADGNYYCYETDGEGGTTLLLGEEYIDKVQETDRNLFRFTRDGAVGLADFDGTTLIEPGYDYLKPLPDWELALARIGADGEYCYGLVDFQGSVAVAFGEYDYSSYGQPESGLLQVIQKGEDGSDKVGYLDLSDLTLKIPAIYDSAGNFYGGLAAVSRDGLYGLIDTDGNQVYPMEYKMASVVSGDGTVFLLRESKAGGPDTGCLYDAQGNLLYEAQDIDYVVLRGECYELHLKNDKIRYLTLSGKLVGSDYFSYIRTGNSFPSNISVGSIWGSDKNYNAIIKTGAADTAVTEMEGAVLRNAVTPRNTALFQVFLEKMKSNVFSESTRKQFRFFLVDSCEQPLLYYYEEPYMLWNFPMSESGFYQMQDGQAVEIISGYECGGSLRGDRATLWYDRETGHVLPGIYGVFGGFGGYNYGGTIYKRVGNSFDETASFYCTEWFSAEAVTEYVVNGNQVTIERYQEERNRYKELYSEWF